MPEEIVWKTSISKVEPNKIIIKGHRIEELMGKVPLSSVAFLLLMGRMPSEKEARMIDAILVSSVDHSVTPPTTMVARTVASAGVPLPTAVAAGILAVGDAHGGAIENAARIFKTYTDKMDSENVKIGDMARKLVEDCRARKEVIPGFGHRLHKQDPRTKRLYEMAIDSGIAGKNVNLSLEIEKIFEKEGKPLPINVDGAIAALILDMGFDYRLGKAFFLLSRVFGLVAHVYEEQSREKPMRRMFKIDTEYDGPWEKELT